MIHLLRGYAAAHGPDGEVTWRSEFLENALMSQGEKDVLDVYLREQSHKQKWLALFDMTGGDDPAEDDTIEDLSSDETKSPGVGGYARQRVMTSEWGIPILQDDYKSTGDPKVFGPMTDDDAFFTHVLVLTSELGVAAATTLTLAYVALGARIQIAVGLTFTFTPAVTAF